MSNEISPEDNLDKEDFNIGVRAELLKHINLLSTRNQKRFGKLLNSVELKIKSSEDENNTLIKSLEDENNSRIKSLEDENDSLRIASSKSFIDVKAAAFFSRIKSLEDENDSLKEAVRISEDDIKELEEVREITLIKEKKYTILSEQDILSARYVDSRDESEEVKTLLSPYSSSMSTYGNEIIWFSIIVGLVFDFLLWKDIFHGKFGVDSWAERAERASAIIMSFSYAYISSQLGIVSAVKSLVNKRKNNKDTNHKEIEVYNKFTSKNTFLPTIVLFILLTVLSTTARYTEKGLELSDKFILSLAAFSIGLVIAMISYWYHDVYDYFIKAAANEEKKNKKLLDKLNKKMEKNK